MDGCADNWGGVPSDPIKPSEVSIQRLERIHSTLHTRGWWLVGQDCGLVSQTKKEANSIAFGSAPRREVDSQPISQLDRPAVRQTETHTLGFLLVADTLCSSRDHTDFKHWWWPSGNACHCKLVGRRIEP